MDRKKIIDAVKRHDEDKVAVSLRLPITLKDKLQKFSDKEGISMNSLIVETLYAMLDDECGTRLRMATSYLSKELEDINQSLHELDEYGVDEDTVPQYGRLLTTKKQIESILG